jgi:hypothetical protein
MSFKVGDKGLIRVKNIFVSAEVTAINLPMVFTHQGNSIATPTLVTYLDDVGMTTYSAITPDGIDPRNGYLFELHAKRPETEVRICPIYNDGSPPLDFHKNTPENRTEFFSDKRIVGLLEATYTFSTGLYSGHSFAPNPNLVEREVLYGNSATPPKDSIQEAFEGLFKKDRTASTADLFDRLFAKKSDDLRSLFDLQDEAVSALHDGVSPMGERAFIDIFDDIAATAKRLGDAGKADIAKIRDAMADQDVKFLDLDTMRAMGPLAGVATVRALINEVSRLGQNELLQEITRKDRENWKTFMQTAKEVLFPRVDKSDPKD